MRLRPLLTILLCTALAAGTAWAQPAAPAVNTGPPWTTLTPAQQQALAPLQQDWAGIDANRKAKWLDVAARFPRMPAEERARIQERMAAWARLSPAERTQARIQFQEARQLPAAERQAKWDAYQALPEQTRQELAQQAKKPASNGSGAAKSAEAKPPVVGKVNVVERAPAPRPKAVSPTVVQARPGATTTLLSQPVVPPVHQQAGLPKIAATKDFVQPKTLLPKHGPQGAAVRPVAAAASTPPDAAQ